MLKAVHAQEYLDSATAKAEAVTKKLEGMRLSKAAQKVHDGAGETFRYYRFPS